MEAQLAGLARLLQDPIDLAQLDHRKPDLFCRRFIDRELKPSKVFRFLIRRMNRVGVFQMTIAKVETRHSHQDDADYWQSRADRTKRQANQFHGHTREHLMKLAAGYEQLARNARNIGGVTDLTAPPR
jgi:hypothetical protein